MIILSYQIQLTLRDCHMCSINESEIYIKKNIFTTVIKGKSKFRTNVRILDNF